MEQNTQALPITTSSTTSLTAYSPTLQLYFQQNQDNASTEIIKALHTGDMFRYMVPSNVLLAADAIILFLKLHTGLKIPTGPVYKVFKSMLAESLKDDYEFYTVELIKLAFKKYALVLVQGKDKSFGRDLSIADVHVIMNAFIADKQIAEREYEQFRQKQNTHKEAQITEDEKQNIIRRDIQEDFYKYALTGNHGKYTYVQYNQIHRDGLVQDKMHINYLSKSLQKVKEKYTKLLQECNNMKNGENAVAAVQAKLNIINEIEEAAKVNAIELYFTWLVKNGKTAVYAEP